MLTVPASVTSVDEIVVDAYARLLRELTNTKDILSRSISENLMAGMSKGVAAQAAPQGQDAKRYETPIFTEINPRASVSGQAEPPLVHFNDVVRQLADVRAKNTALEEANRNLLRRLKTWEERDAAEFQHPWDIEVPIPGDPLGLTAREVIRQKDKITDELRAKNFDLTHQLRDLQAKPFQPSFTQRCARMVEGIHGPGSAGHLPERVARFMEEAFELAQACGTSKSQLDVIALYVYGRPPGAAHQEIGGAEVCLGALAACLNFDTDNCRETELARCHLKAEAIKEKGLSKPHSISPYNRDRKANDYERR